MKLRLGGFGCLPNIPVLWALIAWLVASFIGGFQVATFWTAVWGAIAYSLISWACSALILGGRKT